MMDTLVEKYNAGQLSDRILFHKQCWSYYEQCYKRLRQGERFFPYGLTNVSYNAMLLDLSFKLLSLEYRPIGSYTNILTHYELNFRNVRIWDIDWKDPIYFMEIKLKDDYVRIHQVVDIIVEKVHKRKWRFALSDDGSIHHLPFSDSLHIRRWNVEPGEEDLISEDKVPNDWEFLLHKYFSAKPASEAKDGATILLFKDT